jgi:hypothetical protein
VTEPMEPHTWLEITAGLGDSRMDMRIALRMDGLALLEIGAEDVQGTYDTMLDVDQLTDLIDMLTMVRDTAKEMNDG